jgi:4-hydroxythreonine-4-phosphate dehydrogenase
MKPIAITLGDPAGVGTEVVFKAIHRSSDLPPLWLFGNAQLTREALAALGLQPDYVTVDTLEAARGTTSRTVLVDIGGDPAGALTFGSVRGEYGHIALASINAALDAIEMGLCSALVTAPINKTAVAATGSLFRGHTEMLAHRAGLVRYGRDYAMFFDSPTLRVVLLSVHLPLSKAIATIDPLLIGETAELTTREFARLYGKKPRIAVAGVNPHAGEEGLFGDEESIIAEGVRRCTGAGLDVTGPHAPDTVFFNSTRGASDVVMAIYHDQGLIAVKTLHFAESVNVTLGLPYIRASVDHGTAFDIAGRGVADDRPMDYALHWAARHAARAGEP